MNGQKIIAKSRENESALRARGVTHAALFGSRARGDNRPDSDTDIMIEIDPDAPVGVYEYVRIKEYIASLFERRVDVVDREGLKPYVRPAATADAIYAFQIRSNTALAQRHAASHSDGPRLRRGNELRGV
jgi:hypothetical protein